jgi:uncharacterized UBP type Zn finger protein
MDIISKIYQDVIFIDPPWGGKSYKDFETVSITIGDNTLEDICEKIRIDKLCKMIILKLPLNYNIENFSDQLKENMQIEQLPKMLVLVFLIK